MSDDEYDTHCPLCVEEMDLSDQNFLPCPCGYKVCMWCWHHIRENMNGLCPACRTPYNSDPHAFSAVDRQDIIKLNKEKRQKEKQEKKTAERVVVAAAPVAGVRSTASTVMDRKHLHNYRVVQRNLVYVIGVPAAYASEENLRRPEFFGQYGKIGKVVIHRNHSSAHSTVSVYVTFTYKEDARASIQSLDGHWLDQNHLLRASFGTTKYCNNFIRGVPCNNPECVYLHDLGDDDDRFTKEEIQAGHSKIPPVPGKDQTLVTGCGGPSGTGKRPTGEPVLPPPVFIQDNYPASNTIAAASAAAAASGGAIGSTAGSAALSGAGVGTAAPPSTTLPPPPGVGVGIVLGRPAAVSRSGTATWGSTNTIAAITSSLGEGALSALNTPNPNANSSSNFNNSSANSFSIDRNDNNTPMNFPTLASAMSGSNLSSMHDHHAGSSSGPTTILKRNTSSSVNVAALDAGPPGMSIAANNSIKSNTNSKAPGVSSIGNFAKANAAQNSTAVASSTATPAAPSAPAASATATSSVPITSTPQTTDTQAATEPVPVVAKVKPKTSKELAVERKALAAAARAEKLEQKQAMKAALAAEAAALAASTPPPPPAPASTSNGEAESKSNNSTAPIVPTPKLSAKQQMLANRAEKAARAQAAVLAAQEAREAARALKETSKNKSKDKVTAVAAIAVNAPTPVVSNSVTNNVASIPASAASENTQDLSILSQVPVNTPCTPVSAAANTTAAADGNAAASDASVTAAPSEHTVRGFNGLSVNSLFPVPVSSLTCSVWNNILLASNSDLTINPYGQLQVPYSELLDLMLPPVDALVSSAPCWPRPLAYYAQGMHNGVTFSPAGKHIHTRSSADMHRLPATQMLPSSVVQSTTSISGAGSVSYSTVTPAQYDKVNSLLSAISSNAYVEEMPVLVPAPSLAPPPGVSHPAQGAAAPSSQPSQAAPGAHVAHKQHRSPGPPHSNTPVTSGIVASPTPAPTTANSTSGTSINALRQLFPGVKMSVSASK